MVQRFTLIQGGLTDRPSAPRAPRAVPAGALSTHGLIQGSDGSADAVVEGSAGWRVDLRARHAVDAAAVAAWRAMLVRSDVRDPLHDPAHLLPLAQHRSPGHRVAVALAWSQDAATGREALRGVVPLAMPHPVWGRRARPWQPAEMAVPALVENAAAEAVDRALRARLGALRRPIRLVGSVQPERIVAAMRPSLAAGRPARSPRAIPAEDILGIRPQGWEPPAREILAVAEPEAVRDAVETFLALDARTAERPIIADPSEASLVRVVSRLFGRRGALRVEFLRRAGEIVAGTLHLGAGAAFVPWRRARI